MIYHLSLLSFGDNLISLSLLAKLRAKSGVSIIGTALTQRVASFVPDLGVPLRLVSDRIPAFYDVRNRGVGAAFRDSLMVWQELRRVTARGDELIFEKSGWRGRLLAGAIVRRSWTPERRRNVYEDRRDVLNHVFGDAISLENAPSLKSLPRVVTINPASRQRAKALSSETLAAVVAYMRARSIDVRLMDPDEQHGALKHVVSSYHVNTTLEEAVDLVETCDLYIGADSLFVHVAYHRRRPVLVLYNETNLYFAPPGVEEQGSYVDFVARRTRQELWSVLDRHLSSR